MKAFDGSMTWTQICAFGNRISQRIDVVERDLLCLNLLRQADNTMPPITQVQPTKVLPAWKAIHPALFGEGAFTYIQWESAKSCETVIVFREDDQPDWQVSYRGPDGFEHTYFRALVGAAPQVQPMSGLYENLMRLAAQASRQQDTRRNLWNRWANMLAAADTVVNGLASLPLDVAQALRQAIPPDVLQRGWEKLKRKLERDAAAETA